jgi:hypothetical protein
MKLESCTPSSAYVELQWVVYALGLTQHVVGGAGQPAKLVQDRAHRRLGLVLWTVSVHNVAKVYGKLDGGSRF